MLKIVCFGEALIDLLSNKIADQNVEIESFQRFAGGAPANVAVAIAKLGGRAFFSGMLSTDSFGKFLFNSLNESHVNTEHIKFTQQAKTALAFVSLDECGERTFEFYREKTADLCFQANDFEPQWFEPAGIFHFCSNSLTDPTLLAATIAGIQHAKENNWLISFDVNLRLALWPKNTSAHQTIMNLLPYADIIKMSMEELVFMANEQSHQHFIENLLNNNALILITNGGQPVLWFTRGNYGEYQAPVKNVVDTTAAGDAFIGGFLYQISQHQVTKNTLQTWLAAPKNIEQAVKFAAACGAHAVSIAGAFPSLPTLTSIQPFLNGQAHE